MSSNQPSNVEALSEQALQILRENNQATLATLSQKQEGFPFASVVNYSLAPNSEPVFLLSSMATHSKNIRKNANASLLISSDGELSSGRLTLIGTVNEVSPEDAEALKPGYIEANQDAAQWAEFADFRFYRMAVLDSYIVAGFGAMGWIGTRPFE